jgi:hypothetical protein
VNRSIAEAIDAERTRQENLWAGTHSWGHGSCASDGVAPEVKAAVLMEEAGEVARAVLEQPDFEDSAAGVDELRRELVQCAAVCVAWLESLEEPQEAQEVLAL